MSKRIRVRLLFVLFVSALSVFLLMKQGIRLGLDLRGGTLLILQVVTDDAIRAETDRAIERLRQELQQALGEGVILVERQPVTLL